MAGLIKLLAIFAVFFIVAGLLVALGAVRSSSRSDAEAATAEEIRDVPPALNVTPSQLVRTYQASEAAASTAYNGLVIIVEGPTGANQSNYLKLHAYEVWAVRCFASDEEIDKVRVLSKPENRSLDNRRMGFVITDAGGGMSVGHKIPIFAFKGKIEGVNDKHLTIDLRGCTLQDST